MKGITFYKLRSPYPEDRTKNCGLTGEEIDNNFFNLKSEDIENAYWDNVNKVLVLERVDGSTINIKGIVDGLDDFSFSYNSENGILSITAAGHNYEVEGFTTPDMINKICSDGSINGDGTLQNPLTLSSIARTGVYQPAIKLFDIINNEELPTESQLKKGDRYVTLERISDYGLLYNFNGIKRIANDLRCQNSEWRIPSKDDWDGMLNAIEPCPEYRNHNSTSSNRALGYLAGKYLKANDYWTLECEGCDNTCTTTPTYPDGCINDTQDVNPTPNKGIDSFGFKVMPAGYGDGGNVMDYFSQRAVFWTSTQISITDIYVKRFDYNRSTVYQEAVGPNMLLSLRLVKDYTGDNFNERETINGYDYTCVLMPDINGTPKIWTVDNINFSNAQYCPVEPNSGYGLTFKEKYFVNEWDGFKWIKHELKENESIILNLGPNGKLNQEWRVVNGSLESIPDMIYNDVLSAIKTDINAIDDKLNDEINRAKAAEEKLTSDLANEINRSTTADQVISSNLANEAARAQEAETTIANNLANEAARAQEAETKLMSDLSNEVARATEAETTIAGDLANEAARAQEAETTIANNLANEAARAQEAETTIANNLANVDAKLNQEINDRINNDIKKDVIYTLNVNEGLTLLTNDNTEIKIEIDGNYGNY